MFTEKKKQDMAALPLSYDVWNNITGNQTQVFQSISTCTLKSISGFIVSTEHFLVDTIWCITGLYTMHGYTEYSTLVIYFKII